MRGVRAASGLLFPVKHLTSCLGTVKHFNLGRVISTEKKKIKEFNVDSMVELLILIGAGLESGRTIEWMDGYWAKQLDRNYELPLKAYSQSA